jgi:hypothetical protein
MHLKARYPLIVTARAAEGDLEPFNVLRQKHFPPERNFLQAHLTMFHRLPGEYLDQVAEVLARVSTGTEEIVAEVSGVRHLGGGVAFTIVSLELHNVRAQLKTGFALGPQDMQKWQPHLTVQNKVSKAAADGLYGDLLATFRPTRLRLKGLDMWRYLNGPWQHVAAVPFPSAGGNGLNYGRELSDLRDR